MSFRIVFNNGLTLTRDNVMECKTVAEIDLYCNEIPANSASLLFDDGSEHHFYRRQSFVIEADVGSGRRAIGRFYVTRAYCVFGTTYRVEALDTTALMTSKGVSDTLYDSTRTENVLNDVIQGTFIPDIDEDLRGVMIGGLLLSGTRRDQLLQACAASNAICDTTGVASTFGARFFLAKTEADAITIPEDRVYSGGELSFDDQKSGVVITYRDYTVLPYGEDYGDQYDEVRILKTSSGDPVVSLGITQHTYSVANPNNAAEEGSTDLEDWSGCYLITSVNYSRAASRAEKYLKCYQRYTVKILWNGELPGDYVAIPTTDHQLVKGNIVRMDFVLSTKNAAEIEIVVDKIEDIPILRTRQGPLIRTRDGDYITRKITADVSADVS